MSWRDLDRRLLAPHYTEEGVARGKRLGRVVSIAFAIGAGLLMLMSRPSPTMLLVALPLGAVVGWSVGWAIRVAASGPEDG